MGIAAKKVVVEMDYNKYVEIFHTELELRMTELIESGCTEPADFTNEAICYVRQSFKDLGIELDVKG